MPRRTPAQTSLRDDVVALLRDRWLLGLLVLGFLLRVLVAATAHPDVVASEGALYASGASVLRATGELDTGYLVRPPLYFLFLAAVQSLWGRWVALATLLQCAAGAAAAIPVSWTARRVAGTGNWLLSCVAGPGHNMNPNIDARQSAMPPAWHS